MARVTELLLIGLGHCFGGYIYSQWQKQGLGGALKVQKTPKNAYDIEIGAKMSY